MLFAQIWRESTANTHCVQQKSTIRYPVADKIMNLTPPTLASETSLNERNRPAYSTRVNLDIVDGSIREVVAPGDFFRLQIKYICVRTIYVSPFLLSESAYDETEIVTLPKVGAASMEHTKGVPKSQLPLMKSA